VRNIQEDNKIKDYVLLIDDYDRVVGIKNTKKEYDLKEILHRGYLVTLFERHNGNIVIAQRNANKKLWSDYWDGTVASHLRRGSNELPEDYMASAKDRVQYELGAEALHLKYLSKFRYYTGDSTRGLEQEICALFTGFINTSKIKPNPEEVSGIKLMSPAELMKDMKKNVDIYSPWFKAALLYA